MDADTDRRKSGVYRHRARGMSSGPVSVGDAIRQVVDGLGMTGRLREQRVLSLWEEVVGEEIAAATQVEGFYYGRSQKQSYKIPRGQLVVSVKNSTWRHWLSFQRETIRQNLNRAVGGEVVQMIRLR